MGLPPALAPGFRTSHAQIPPVGGPFLFHDDGIAHFHEWSEEERDSLAEMLWNLENVELSVPAGSPRW